MKTINKQVAVISVVSVLLVISTLIASAIFLLAQRQKPKNGLDKLVPLSVVSQLHQLIPKQGSRTNLKERQVVWVRQDGKKMAINGYGFEVSFLDKQPADKFESGATYILRGLGYAREEKNSRIITYYENEQIKITGFEKDSNKCLIRLGIGLIIKEDEYRYWVLCADRDQQSEYDFETFYPLINQSADSDIIVSVSQNDGLFATGGVWFDNQYSGADWIAKKENGGWIKVYEGQDWPLCSAVKGIPKEFYDRCWEGNQLIL